MNDLARILSVAALGAMIVLTGCETVQTTEAGAVGVTREQRVTSLVIIAGDRAAGRAGVRAGSGGSSEKGTAEPRSAAGRARAQRSRSA